MSKCISECSKCQEFIVESISAGTRVRIRLVHLGLYPGVKIIKTKQAPFNGPIELKVKGTNIVIGNGLAEKIMVKCIE